MPFVSKLLANRNLLKNLVLRDLKHRYIGSLGGFVWSVIHPLVTLASYSFVFTVVMLNLLLQGLSLPRLCRWLNAPTTPASSS